METSRIPDERQYSFPLLSLQPSNRLALWESFGVATGNVYRGIKFVMEHEIAQMDKTKTIVVCNQCYLLLLEGCGTWGSLVSD